MFWARTSWMPEIFPPRETHLRWAKRGRPPFWPSEISSTKTMRATCKQNQPNPKTKKYGQQRYRSYRQKPTKTQQTTKAKGPKTNKPKQQAKGPARKLRFRGATSAAAQPISPPPDRRPREKKHPEEEMTQKPTEPKKRPKKPPHGRFFIGGGGCKSQTSQTSQGQTFGAKPDPPRPRGEKQKTKNAARTLTAAAETAFWRQEALRSDGGGSGDGARVARSSFREFGPGFQGETKRNTAMKQTFCFCFFGGGHVKKEGGFGVLESFSGGLDPLFCPCHVKDMQTVPTSWGVCFDP